MLFTIVSAILLLFANICTVLFAYFRYLQYLSPNRGYLYSLILLVFLFITDYQIVTSYSKVTSTTSNKRYEGKQISLSSMSPFSLDLSSFPSYSIDFMGIMNRIESSSIDDYNSLEIVQLDVNISLDEYEAPTIASLQSELKMFSNENKAENLTEKILSQFEEENTKVVVTEVTKLETGESSLILESTPLNITIKEYLLLLDEVPLSNEIKIKSLELDSNGKIQYLELTELHQI